MVSDYIKRIIKEEIKKLYEVSDYFYGMKDDGKSVKISYLNFTKNLEFLLKQKNINLGNLVLNNDWKTINKYISSGLEGLSSNPTLDVDFKSGKQVRTHDSKKNIESKIRIYLKSYYSPTKIEKRKKEK